LRRSPGKKPTTFVSTRKWKSQAPPLWLSRSLPFIDSVRTTQFVTLTVTVFVV